MVRRRHRIRKHTDAFCENGLVPPTIYETAGGEQAFVNLAHCATSVASPIRS